MDAGAASDRPRPEEGEGKARPQENQDDGYETSNSGDTARRKPSSPETSPAQGSRPAPPPLDAPAPAPAPLDMSAVAKSESEQDDSVKSDKLDKLADEHKMEPEPDAESRTAGGSSLSNSPKRTSVALNPEDSHSNLSAEASNSQSNSSLGTMRSTQPGYDVENLNARLLPPQEDSSSQQSHDRYPGQMRNLQNPFDMNKSLHPQFNQRGQDPLNFGSIKREAYDLPDAAHEMYPQYRREDQYPRDLYPKYNKRPDEMYNSNPYKGDMSYNFGMKREMDNPYEMKNQYDQSQQMYGGIKREQEEMMYNGIKRECADDPYSFVDEDAMCAMLGGQNAPGQHNPAMMGQVMHHMGHPEGHMGMSMPNQQMMLAQPKKRGRKKKIKDENGMEIKQEPGMDGMLLPVKPVKERKKHDRFNGMSEEEVSRRTLPDHLAENLDIIIIGINPGLFAAYKGHHYAGPGNHFWKCLYLSGLTREQMSADEDYKLLNFGIGFTNMVQRATKGSADLTRREIKEGSAILLEKLQTFRPKVAVFNGKLIYEVFSGKKDFCFGKQPDTIHGTNTYMWVMPSSSARCAQLPRAADKVPFYAALKKFRDYLNGAIHHVDEAELIFPDTTCRRPHEEIEIRRLTMEPEACDTMILEDGTEVPLKKKRGRPKKIKLENGEVVPPTPRAPRQPRAPQPPLDINGEQPPKKKRGRPKKIRPEEQQFLLQQQQQNQAMMAAQLPPLPSMNTQQPMENQYNMHQNPEFQNQGMSEPMNQNSMMYQGNMTQGQQSMGQDPMGGNQDTSPYYQTAHNPTTMPQGPPSAPQMDNSGPLDMGPNVPTGPTGTPVPMGQMQRPQGYSQSPGPYSQSPRPQGMGYSQSPRPQGYAQSPQRHQSVTPSYSNSPVPRPTGTPQPTPPVHSPFPSSPAQQNPNPPGGAPFSQTSPQRPQSQNHSYSSPVRNPYSRSPIPQNNTPTYSQPQQSPMYAQSPANSGPGQGYQQLSPASQSVGGYASQSPAPNRFSQSPAPLGHPYSRSPAPQGLGQPYSQSPAPQSAPFPQHSPAMGGGGQSYTPSPAHTPYSQHNSPAASTQGRGQGYSNSPVPHHFGAPSPLHPSQTRQQGSMPFSQSPPDQSNVQRQEYGTDLSSEISAAISSPPPVSPGMGHIDFEPPIATNKIRVPENEAMGSQENSPLGSTDMHAGSNSNSSLSDFNKSSNVSESQNYDQHSQSISSQNRHSALNLIGPPSSTPSDMSSPIPASMESMANLSSLRNTPTYGNPMYGDTMNSQHSPLQHEQRLGFQVPTPTGAASSPYGQGGGLSMGASPSPKGSHDGGGPATHHDRLANTYGYQGDQGGNVLSSSPRLSEAGGNMMPAHQLHQHPIYSNPFNRSTPPAHSLPTVGSGQPSPFSPPAPAFRPPSEAAPQSAGSPGEYGGAPKTKAQDVASKSLSGLESLVDQIPSIAEGGPAPETLPPHPAPVPPLPDPYAAHPPSLYSPYTAYPSPAYGAPNNTYPSPLTAGSFVGYPGNPYGQLMRPTPGYLPEALSYHHHPHPGPYPPQYGGTGTGYGGPPPPHNYAPYYNGYAPPSAIQNPAAMPTYLTSHVLDHIHKNAAADAASSVSFGSFC